MRQEQAVAADGVVGAECKEADVLLSPIDKAVTQEGGTDAGKRKAISGDELRYFNISLGIHPCFFKNFQAACPEIDMRIDGDERNLGKIG